MVSDNTSAFKTAFTVSIEAKRGVTTGISAADRATTILTAIADGAKPEDLARPGHIFPAGGQERRACWCGPARPRGPWTWRGWPG